MDTQKTQLPSFSEKDQIAALTKTVRIPNVDHPVRLLVLWKTAHAKEPRKVPVTNRIHTVRPNVPTLNHGLD